MTTLVYTPFDGSTTVDLSGGTIFRKQILPLGSIQYKGRRLDFTREYLSNLVAAFKDRAYDQVSFILADPDNKHNMNPENWRGAVRGFELTDAGLDATIELTPGAADLVRNNPRLGVSAQIVEGYERADGKRYSQAIRHVLGTLDPRVPGMSPWQAVDLASGPVHVVIDLTEHTYEGSGEMPQTNTDEQVDPSDDLEPIDDTATDDTDTDESVEEVEDTDGEAGDLDVSSLSDEDLLALLNGDQEPEPASLSGDDDGYRESVDLANAGVEELRQHVSGLQAEVARSRFEAERHQYLTAGVPPHLVDLAAPVLSSPEATVIELSNGDEVDTAEVLRSVLRACAGYVDLSAELGTSNTTETPSDPDQGLLDAWDAEYPA